MLRYAKGIGPMAILRYDTAPNVFAVLYFITTFLGYCLMLWLTYFLATLVNLNPLWLVAVFSPLYVVFGLALICAGLLVCERMWKSLGFYKILKVKGAPIRQSVGNLVSK